MFLAAGTVSDVSDVQLRKAELRAQVLARRSALPVDQRTAAGKLIRDAVLDEPQVQMAGTIAAYYSVGTEPDTRGLVYALWKRGSYVLLPLLRPDGDLDWASFEGPDSLVAGPRGLREPGEPPRGVDAVARADAVLVPALAVDAAGRRLGRGGGSYDRALARVGPLVPLIALIYDDELVEQVPAEGHDVPVRAAHGSAHRGGQAYPRRGAGCAPGADGRHDRGLLLHRRRTRHPRPGVRAVEARQLRAAPGAAAGRGPGLGLL